MKYLLIEMFSALAVLIPVFMLLGKFKFHDFPKITLYFVFAVYLAAAYHLVGLPTSQFFTFDVNLNLIPFAGMIDDFKNTCLNVLLFVPLGFFLPMLWTKYRRMGNTLLFGLCMTIGIELLQLLTLRATDINDVITNFLGTWLGYCLFVLVKKYIPKTVQTDNQTRNLAWIFAAVIVVMFFVQPWITSLIYSVM